MNINADVKINRNTDGKPVPDWKLERYLLGELPAVELEAILALERSDAELRGRVDALRAEGAELLRRHPLDAQARAKPSRPCPFWARMDIYRWALPAFACAALLVVLPMRLQPPASIDTPINTPVNASVNNNINGMIDEGTRVKGTGATPRPGIEVWRKAGESAERLAPGALTRAGDTVQLKYSVPEFCYGALLSVDGRGVLTLHLSGDSGKAAPLSPGRPVALKSSYQLDDAPKFEAFYLITAADNFDIDGVERALKRLEHPLDGMRKTLPQQQDVTAFTLKK
ncbi:MAG: hypothetical protein LBB74_05470 [Chitinispirillales bacterium]|jgi:hypothetical protein|nr:hypothetical protein [Chitinispirillales bacterium]